MVFGFGAGIAGLPWFGVPLQVSVCCVLCFRGDCLF